MPVTFFPAGNKAESHEVHVDRYNRDPSSPAARTLFESSHRGVYGLKPPSELYSSSYPMDAPVDPNIRPVLNGFVHTVLEAYNKHHMVVIRPDDVWISILTQFNFFVNANAETLRGAFVSHEGKKDLVLQLGPISRYRTDINYASAGFVDLMHEHITDSSVREWIMPDFTTTTQLDKTVGAIVMMSTFQRYFNYDMVCGCGITAVTLEGEKSDWQSILRRIEKLKEYGLQTTAWYHLLRPVLKRFVAAFDDPSNAENASFWNRVAAAQHLMSGLSYLSGWITAFCVFDRKGRYIGPQFLTNHDSDPDYTDLSAESFAAKYLVPEDTSGDEYQGLGPCLVLDGVRYSRIGLYNVPPGVVGVDVKIVEDKDYQAGIVAGLNAYQILSSGDNKHSMTGERDTLRPMMGWWLYEKNLKKSKYDEPRYEGYWD